MKVPNTTKYDVAIEGMITLKELKGSLGPLDGVFFDQTYETRIR